MRPQSLSNAELTGPGAPFEIVDATVHGQKMRVFAQTTGTLSGLYQSMPAHGDRDFIVEGDRRLSYAQAHADTGALAAVLSNDFGVRAGDRVAIAMRNCAEWMLSFIAASALGAVPALINSRGTGPEMRYCIDDIGAALVIADRRRSQALRDAGYDGPILEVDGDAYAAALAGRTGQPLSAAVGGPDDPACILFTSGTTGRPKGAILTHRAILTGLMIAQHAGALLGLRMAAQFGIDPAALAAAQPQAASLLIFPLFHISGCQSIFLSSLARGGKIVLMRRWDAEQALQLIEAERITAFSGPPTVIWDMLRVPDREVRDLTSLKSLGTGGQALAPNLLRAMQQGFPWTVIGGGYGMTETAGAISLAMGEEYTSRPESSGRVHPLAEVRIVDDAGRELPPGEVGEIWVRGPMVMAGYWGKPAETAKASGPDGWLRTGDVGSLDADGYLTVVDRKTDMVISSGENIYCAEVERVLMEHPDIAEATAFGVPDERLGERLVVAVVPQPGRSVTEEAVQTHVGHHLAAYKVPRAVVVETTPLPRNATGKVDKRALRAGQTAQLS